MDFLSHKGHPLCVRFIHGLYTVYTLLYIFDGISGVLLVIDLQTQGLWRRRSFMKINVLWFSLKVGVVDSRECLTDSSRVRPSAFMFVEC